MLPYGEDVSLSSTLLRKRMRAVRGFTVPLQPGLRRKLRRQVRDTPKNKRRARRGRRANRVRARRRSSH